MVKRIFRYLKFTPEFGLWYSVDSSLVLVGFSDASVVLSSTKAEYVAAASCCSQILWMRQTLQDYGLSYDRVSIFIDNVSAISIAKNPVLHSRTKHIDIRFHFLRDNHERGHIDLIHVPSERQTADILTKPLEQDTFARLRGELGVCYPF